MPFGHADGMNRRTESLMKETVMCAYVFDDVRGLVL